MVLIRSLLKLALLVAAAVAVYWGFELLADAREVARMENRAHRLFTHERYDEAAEVYRQAIERLEQAPAISHDPARIRQLQALLARCYVRRAEDPALPLAESLYLYRRALRYDPDTDIDETVQRLLRRQNGGSADGYPGR